MDFRADLHVHSCFSDGSETPQQLLYLARQKGLQGLSITDHDTISAYSKELFQLAKDLGIYLLPGIEISSSDNVHILGYGISLQDENILAMIRQLAEWRTERNKQILDKFSSIGISISLEDLSSYVADKRGFISPVLGRAHIAQYLLDHHFVASYQEAFNRYLKENGLCYVSGTHFSPEEIILGIHAAQGKAVLAHPHRISQKDLVEELLQKPFDGIEAYYAKELPASEHPWKEIALAKGWIITGGSDFHGNIRSHIDLGCSWVNQETFFQLFPKKDPL
ncbi:MAG: PHP domain-containing protein [Parachlamydiales bacterium]|nr:PHP domain-containing protein [Parachlamydiales bacterium]